MPYFSYKARSAQGELLQGMLLEEGVPSLCDSRIIAPSGEILAAAQTEGDELIVADCDLDWCKQYTGTLFDFDRYRRPEVYTHLTTQRGVRQMARR